MTQLPWKFYTWEDVDRYCELNRDYFGESITGVDVYPYSIEIRSRFESKHEASAIMKDLFQEKYNSQTEEILIDSGNSIKVNYIPCNEERECDESRHSRPLFSSLIYSKNKHTQQQLTSLAVPVFAFHSYRSDDSNERALRNFSRSYGYDGAYKKFLIVDADISSPIMSFAGEHSSKISYIDILNMLMNVTYDSREHLLQLASNLLKSSNDLSDNIFISCFRYKEQLFDTMLPDSLFAYYHWRQFCIQEALAQISLQLNLDAVLINLGSGISEYSSTFLFDNRVTKFLIPSFNSQSGEKLLSDMIDYTPINKFL